MRWVNFIIGPKSKNLLLVRYMGAKVRLEDNVCLARNFSQNGFRRRLKIENKTEQHKSVFQREKFVFRLLLFSKYITFQNGCLAAHSALTKDFWT